MWCTRYIIHQQSEKKLRNGDTKRKKKKSMLDLLLYVCVSVFPVTVWGPNIPTSIVIPVNFVLVGTFFGPHEENS